MSIARLVPGEDAKRITIAVEGRFDYALHKAFRQCYIDHQHDGMEYAVDLSAAEYMDSSALGMLLLLKEHVENRQGRVRLESPQPFVRKVLEIANFERFFPIS